jgi:hypothetical protein
MENMHIYKKVRGIRLVSFPVLGDTCRNESGFENIVWHAQDTFAAKTIYFAGTNRACSDKMMLKVTNRIEAESTCYLPFSASKKGRKK